MTNWLEKSPNYRLYRSGLVAIDAVFDDTDLGVQTEHYQKVNVQVIPSDEANPDVEIMWWSEEAGLFIKEHTAITKVGVGSNTPYEFTVESLGRIMMVAVTTLAAGSVEILVSGAILLHPE